VWFSWKKQERTATTQYNTTTSRGARIIIAYHNIILNK
jgi:hypothetical protein